ncbi:MAG: hypothetical protein JST55_04700 [Bacteroidetes bacterium]|nr:hypothetical protein [Bacteroidota bacterium]
MIKNYFDAEKFESLFFVAVGIIAVLISIWFWIKLKDSFYSGMAIPLVLLALIQITVGMNVYFRSPKDIVRVESYLTNDKSKITDTEIPRMNTVMKNFVIYRYIEILLLIAGLVLFFMFSQNIFIKGIGAGLAVQSSLMLMLDFFAEKRGAEYLSYLNNLKL